MNAIFPSKLPSYELRESNPCGWIHATGAIRVSDDKAGFHAMGAIWGG